jgi:beta-glucosidase
MDPTVSILSHRIGHFSLVLTECVGIRGNHFFMSTPAKCLPSATALGATWDTDLIEEAGLKLLAGEAKLRAAPVILAPTCNIQRVQLSLLSPLIHHSYDTMTQNPLGGRVSCTEK